VITSNISIVCINWASSPWLNVLTMSLIPSVQPPEFIRRRRDNDSNLPANIGVHITQRNLAFSDRRSQDETILSRFHTAKARRPQPKTHQHLPKYVKPAPAVVLT
jgi:hypothetical protein